MTSNLSSKLGLSLAIVLLTQVVHTNAQSTATVKQIQISKEVPFDQETLIKKDLNVLKSINFKESTEEVTKTTLGISNVNASTLTNWLTDRISLIIGEKFDLDKRLEVSRERVAYPNLFVKPDYATDLLSDVLAINNDQDNDESVITVMSNIGAAIYAMGKENRILLGLNTGINLAKKEITPILSPRSGIIQIGKGLFHKNLTVSPESPNSLANSINRLGTFFHEARHSDGNGKSLVFGHAKCPKEIPEYAGLSACDRNANGPYTVGVVTILEMTKNCKERCSKAETQVLAMIALDSASRVIKDRNGNPASLWDAKPEIAKVIK